MLVAASPICNTANQGGTQGGSDELVGERASSCSAGGVYRACFPLSPSHHSTSSHHQLASHILNSLHLQTKTSKAQWNTSTRLRTWLAAPATTPPSPPATPQAELPTPARTTVTRVSTHLRLLSSSMLSVTASILTLLCPLGLDFLEKKSGHTMGRDTNEKITDGARGLYEKATG